MSDIFISYSRKDIAFAHILHDELKNHGFNPWIDWEDIPPSSEWLNEIFGAIEKTDIFLIILSSKSTKSKVCNIEIEHAIKNHKRIIPIALPGVNEKEVKSEIKTLNWIFFDDIEKEISGPLKKLLDTINTDLEWVKNHTRFQVKALEWGQKKKDQSLLLRGSDLIAAENWQANSAEKIPGITNIQNEYIQQSRRKSTKQLITSLCLMGISLLAIAGVTIWALYQKNQITIESNTRATAESIAIIERNEAQKQTSITLSNLSALQAEKNLNTDLTLSSLLSVEAIKYYPTSSALNILVQALENEPRLLASEYGQSMWINSLSANPRKNQIASSGVDGIVRIWDSQEMAITSNSFYGNSESILSTGFSSDGSKLAAGNYIGEVFVWDFWTQETIATFQIPDVGGINQIVFFENDQKIAVQSTSNFLILLDLKNMQTEIIDFNDLVPNLSTMSISENGEFIATGSCTEMIDDDTCIMPLVLVWDLHTKDFIDVRYSGQTKKITSLVFSFDGKKLASGGEDYHVMIWDTLSGVTVFDQYAPITTDNMVGKIPGIRKLVFNPSGNLLAGTNGNNQGVMAKDYTPIFIWNVNSNDLLGKPIITTESAVHTLIFYDETKMAVGGLGEITFWDFSKTSVLGNSEELTYGVVPEKLKFNLMLLDSLGIIYATDIINQPNGNIYAIVNPRTINKVDQTTTEIKISFIDSEKKKITQNFAIPSNRYIASKFSENGDLFVILTEDGIFWMNSDGTEIHSLTMEACEGERAIEDGNLNLFLDDCRPDIAISPNNDFVIISGGAYEDFTMEEGSGIGYSYYPKLFIIETQKEQVENINNVPPGTGPIERLAFSPDGKTFISVYKFISDGVIFWDIYSKKAITSLPIKSYCEDKWPFQYLHWYPYFTKDGKRLILGSTDTSMIMIDPISRSFIGPVFAFDSSQLCDSDEGYYRDIYDPLFVEDENGKSVSMYTFDLNGYDYGSYENNDIDLFKSRYSLSVELEDWINQTCIRAGRNFSYLEWFKYFPEEEYRRTCPDLPIHPSFVDHMILNAIDNFKTEDFEGVNSIFEKLVELQVSGSSSNISAANDNNICYSGILFGAQNIVFPLCERAVEMNPENGAFHDSRGIARAIAGDFQGAIEDFQFFINWSKTTQHQTDLVRERQDWIEKLKNGINPFDAEQIKLLRPEY